MEVEAEERARRVGTGAALLLLGPCVLACSGEEAGPTPTQAPPYVSRLASPVAERCADCHEDLVRAWQRSPMARALTPVSRDEFAAADALGSVADSAWSYRFEALESGPAILETRLDSPHRLEVPLVFAIGAGVRDRSFAARWGEFLWFAPLEVLTLAAGSARRAVLAPGHRIHPGTRFTTAITDDCLSCHTDAPLSTGFPRNMASLVEAPARGLSCAACHARTEEHATWQERDLDGEEPAGPDPILRLDELSRPQRLSLCARCHLQGDARIPLTPDVHGRPEPGEDLLERYAVFVSRTPDRGVGFVSQTERLALSRCFLESADLSCVTCHDPHLGLDEPGERARAAAACGVCHVDSTGASGADECPRLEPEGASDADCVTCHMPVREVFDIAEVQVHDHFIRARPEPARGGDPRPRILEAPDGNWRRFTWPGEAEPAGMRDEGLWMAALAQARLGPAALARYAPELGPLSREVPTVQHLAGLLLAASERPREAEAHYRRALELRPDSPESAINLALLLAESGRVDEGIALLDRVVEEHPLAVGALRNRATLRLQRGDAAGFGEDLARAFSLDPRAELARALATLADRAGRPQEGQSWRDRARVLDAR